MHVSVACGQITSAFTILQNLRVSIHTIRCDTLVHAPSSCLIKYLLPNILLELWPSIPIGEGLHRVLSYWFLQQLPRGNTCFRTFTFWAIDSYKDRQGGTPASGPLLRSMVTRCFASSASVVLREFHISIPTLGDDTCKLQHYVMFQLMALRVFVLIKASVFSFKLIELNMITMVLY